MGTLAVLFAVLAVAVPLQESASAQTPEPSISLTVSDVKFETATVDITVTNVNSTNIPALNWRVNVVFKTDAYEHPHKNAGPTHPVSPGQESYSFLYNVSNTGTVTADVDLNWLIPASEYTVEVKLCDTDCGSRNVKAEASTTFSTKSGCTAQPEPNRGKWFPGYHFTKVTENELIVRVHVNSSYAPLNSGRCVYYTYNTYFEHDYSEIRTAYIRHIGSGGRTAQIELTDLEPGTRYGYHITLDEEAEDNAAGFSGSTLGPNTGISDIVFTNITNDSAKATATVKNASTDDKFVYWRYRESPLDGDPGIWLTLDKVSTKTSTADKDLGYLDAGTRYEVEASVKDNFNLGMSMTRAFVTLPGKPGISPLEAGDGSLKVTWTAPDDGVATITGYTVKWQESEEYHDYSTFPPPTSTLSTYDADADDTSYTITGLTNGTEYRVHVIAKNESGGTESNGEFGTPMGIPNAPNNLQIAPGNEKLTLTWEAPTAKEGVTVTGYYKVQWKDSSVADWDSPTGVTEVSVSGLTSEITGLTNGTTYDVRVRADNGVTSDNYYWAEDDGTPRPDPIVTGVTVADNSITRTEATATVAIDNQTGDSQTVHLRHRVNTSGSSWTDATPKDTAGSSETFDLSSLTGNTEHLVEAWLASSSTVKRFVTFTTGPVEPEAPDITSVTHGDGELTVTWTAPTETGGADIEYFVVQWKLNTVSDWTSPLVQEDSTTNETVLTYPITSLNNGTTYDIRVRADNGVEADSYSWDEDEGTPSTKPDAPTITDITGGNERLVVTWDEPDDGGSSITEYTVQWKSGIETFANAATDNRQATVTTLTHTIQGLTNDTLYTVQVRARNENEYGPWSAEDTGTPVPNPSIGVISVKTKSQTGATLTVTIERSDTDNEQTVHLRHRVKSPLGAWQNATPQDTGAGSVDFDISDLTGNTVYKVEAWLAADTNDIAEYELTTSPVIPAAPNITSVTHGDQLLTFTWTAPTGQGSNGGADIERYVIQWKEFLTEGWANASEDATINETVLSHTIDTGLVNGTRYAFRVRADNSVQVEPGKEYNWAHSDGTPSKKPDAPTIQSVTPGHTKLTVTWNKPANGGNQITNYILQWKDNDVAGWDSPLGTRTLLGKDVLTADIGSLANGTKYAIQVRAENGNGEGPWSAEDTGTPRPDPSIDSITVADSTITQTTAIAIVNIAHSTGELKTVHLRYGINTPPIAWETVPSQDTATGSVEFPKLTPLKSDTEYRVEASFDSTFDSGVKFEEFTTKRPTVSSVEIDESTIEQTGATAIVRIQEPNGKSQTVHLRYRPATQTDWSPTASDAGYIPYVTKFDAVSIPIADLKSKTLYEVQASLESDYSQSGKDTFTTDPPTLTDITISEVMQQSAKATIDIEAPNGRPLPVYVRYRKVTDPVNELWAYVDTSSTDATADPDLLNLDSGTKYEAQASLDRGFPDGEFVTSDPFTTTGPSLTGLSWEVEMTSATITATIKAPNDDSQTIHYRYRPTSQTDWSTTATDAGSDSTLSDANSESAEFTLNGLNSSTQYDVEVSFDSDLDSSTRVINTIFSTLSPDTSIKEVEFSDRSQTSVKVIVTLAAYDTNGNTVFLHHRKVGDTAWSTPDKTDDTDPDKVEFPLDELDENTNYEVEVSLDSGFANSTIVPFWTLREPEISSVNAVNPTKTTVEAVVDILYPDDTERTVHLRYQGKVGEGETQDWPSARREQVPSSTNKAEKTLTPLIAGTTYLLQASFDDNFPDTGTEQTEFTTEYLPSVSEVIVDPDTVTKRTATAIVSIANPDDIERTVYLQFRKKDKTPEDEWSDPPLDEDTDAGQVSVPMQSLIPGTEYEVEASFDNTFPKDETKTKKTTFTTKFLPSVSNVRVVPNSVTKTTATAEVSIANPDGTLQTVHLRYIVYSATPDWENDGTRVTTTSDTVTATKGLENLLAGTTYILQASLDTNFVEGVESTTFPTDPEPSAESVSVSNEMETTATATVVIDDSDGSPQTVHLQYRRENAAPTDAWESEQPKTTTSGSETFDLDNLNEGTTYDVEAWLASDTNHKVRAEFTTLQSAPETPHNPPPPPPPPPQQNNPPPQRSPQNPTPPPQQLSPEVASVSVTNETQTTADATVNIMYAGTAKNTVNLRYSVDGEDSWTDHTKTESGSAVDFPLSSLTAGTTYEVEAWLGSATGNKVTATFTTSMAPSISSIGVGGITKTSATATVNIRDAGTAQNTVNLRYSVDGENSWTDHTKTETGSAVDFPLSSLTAGTTYEVEAWLGSDTDNKVTATFMTIQAAAVTPPSISSVRVLNIAQTNARVVVGLANANTGQKVYMQYKLSSAQWPTTLPQPTTQMNGSATFILSSLTAGTGYHTRVSLNSDMSDATTRSFTTSSPPPPQNPPPPRSPVVPPPSVSLVTFNNETQTSADATVNIADAGTAKKTVRLHHRIEGTTGWSTPPKVMKTPGSSTTILLTGLTAGTTYEVQAWLNSNAPPTGTTVYTFNTLPNDPDISNLKMKNIRQTSATAMVEIADAGTGMKEVYLKHSTDGADEWTQIPFPTITYSDSTSINLTGLKEKTTYQVMVDLTDGFDKPKSSTFTTLAAPSLSGVSISSITQTGAVATVTIADAGTAQKTVLLRYREFGETQWSTAQTKTTTGASAVFNLTGLDPRTTYEVQASLDIEFGASKYAVFTTLSPDPSVSGVSVGSITQTSATTTVTIAYPGIARKTVHLRYRVSGETEWGAVQMKATSGGSAAIDLTGLSPRTMYEVEASLSSDFASSKTATFSTLSLDPSVSGVSIGSITQASAAATVTIANPGTAQKIVYLQYRVDGASEWSDSALTATTDGPSATIYMTGIIADTEYEVRASLASDFALAQHATFTTLRYPSIYDVDVTDVTKNTATAEIDIADPDGTDQTVHLRYRTTAPQGTWSSTLTTTSTTGEASIDLTGLTVDTEYEVEASLTSDFAIAVSDTFRTLPPDPVVAEVSVNSIRQTTATAYIDISNANGSTQKVSLRYRTTTPRGAWSGIKTTTSTTDSASIDLSGLTPGTEYDVQASLENSFPSSRTKHDTFTTLRWPSIASFEVENVARNGATVSATIADSRGVAQTVYVRHRATGYIAWRSTQQMDSVDDIASLRLRGLSSGTEYTAEASLDNSFPDGGTRSVTFTTKERDDEDAVDSDIAISTTRTTNVPLLGFTPQMLRFVAIEGGDNPAPQAFSVWNRAQGSMSFNLSNHEEWLSQQPMSGVSNGSDDPVTITASVDSSELASGQYVDVINIDVTSSGKSPGQVIVILDVLPPDYIRQFVSRDEGGIVVLPDGTVKIVVEPESPPKDVDIELMKVNLQAHGQPPGEQERVVVAIESNTYEPGGDTPEDVAYAPYVELWVQLPEEDAAACDEGKTRVYSVETGTWSLIEHRCETDESDKVWAVAEVERLGAFALVIDDAPVPPTPTPVAASLATPANSVIKAAAPAIVRISLPAQPPTPVPTSVPTAVPVPNGETTVAPAMVPTPTAVPAGNEPFAPTMQAPVGDGGSGGFGKIILAALGVPMLIGTLIVVYLLRRERLRREAAGL